MHNGSYSFGGSAIRSVTDQAVAASCVCFGAEGRPVADEEDVRAMTHFEQTDGRRKRAVHSCVVPTSGVCVLVPTTPRQALKTDDIASSGHVYRPPPLPRLHINASGVSVSGISSGADFAVYFSIAHSASVMVGAPPPPPGPSLSSRR
jgi:hypothetical protein